LRVIGVGPFPIQSGCIVTLLESAARPRSIDFA
jgi:hypothetical protein